MADLTDSFTQVVITEREMRRLLPDVPSTFIRDYLSLKRNVFQAATLTDDQTAQITRNKQHIAGILSDTNKNSAVNRDQDRDISALTAEIAALTAVVDALLVIAKNDRQLINRLISDVNKLKASL